MVTTLSTQYISKYLEEVAAQAEQLMSLLQEERDVISVSNGDALEAVTSSKEKLATAIQFNTRQCSQQLQQAGFGNNDLSLSKYIDSCSEPYTSQFRSAWNDLQSVLKQCQEENRINGKLISSSQRQIKQALSIIQGKPVEEDLYGKSGKSINPTSGNTLSHA